MIEAEGYKPAPLDFVSMWNGVLKYEHEQRAPEYVDMECWTYVEEVLDTLYPFMSLHSQLETLENAVLRATDPDHKDKSSGFPWNLLGVPTKKQAIDKYGADALLSFYNDHTACLYATLKDEPRPIGKDARLFRLMSVDAFLEAFMLFERQNTYLVSALGEHPMFICFSSPGFDLSRMFKQLEVHGGELFDADGNAWDTNFSILVASFLAYYRSRGFRSEETRKRIYRYYQMMYVGYTVVAGWVLHLKGQASGHFLTSTDNSLCNIIAMSINAFKRNLSVSEFIDKVKFFCCGDDLVWSDRSALFSPRMLSETYEELGMYLEFTSLEDIPFEQITFVSTHPKYCVYKGMRILTYGYEPRRVFGKMAMTKKKVKPIDRVMRLASYCALLFNTHYEQIHEMLINLITQYLKDGVLDGRDPALIGVMRASSRRFLEDQYWDFEASSGLFYGGSSALTF